MLDKQEPVLDYDVMVPSILLVPDTWLQLALNFTRTMTSQYLIYSIDVYKWHVLCRM